MNSYWTFTPELVETLRKKLWFIWEARESLFLTIQVHSMLLNFTAAAILSFSFTLLLKPQQWNTSVLAFFIKCDKENLKLQPHHLWWKLSLCLIRVCSMNGSGLMVPWREDKYILWQLVEQGIYWAHPSFPSGSKNPLPEENHSGQTE